MLKLFCKEKKRTGVQKNGQGRNQGNCRKQILRVGGRKGGTEAFRYLLLNVGPKADGIVSDEDREVLLRIGKWLAVNGEAFGEKEKPEWNRDEEGLYIKSGLRSDTPVVFKSKAD